jgi:hypothetical protein
MMPLNHFLRVYGNAIDDDINRDLLQAGHELPPLANRLRWSKEEKENHVRTSKKWRRVAEQEGVELKRS